MRPFFILAKPTTKRLTFRTAAVLALLFFSAIVYAADNDTETHTLSLNEAIIKTIEYNPELRAYDYRLKAQQGRIEQAGIAPSPEIGFILEDFLGRCASYPEHQLGA